MFEGAETIRHKWLQHNRIGEPFWCADPVGLFGLSMVSSSFLGKARSRHWEPLKSGLSSINIRGFRWGPRPCHGRGQQSGHKTSPRYHLGSDSRGGSALAYSLAKWRV